MKKILVLILSLFFSFLSFATYDTECEITGAGDVATISVSFNNQGDCKSNDYTAVYTSIDGVVSVEISNPDDSTTASEQIDFGEFDCCEPT